MLTGTSRFRIRGVHPLWPTFPGRFAVDGFVTPQCFRNPGTSIPPTVSNRREARPGLGYFRFRSPLLTESMSLSFPPGT